MAFFLTVVGLTAKNELEQPSQPKVYQILISLFLQRKVVRNNNCIFLLRVKIIFSLFLVEFCHYLEYSIQFLKLFTWKIFVIKFFVSFIFDCKKNIELIFLKFCNNFVEYFILLYDNKLGYITYTFYF